MGPNLVSYVASIAKMVAVFPPGRSEAATFKVNRGKFATTFCLFSWTYFATGVSDYGDKFG